MRDTYTLNEALKMCVDGEEMAHEGLTSFMYMEWDSNVSLFVAGEHGNRPLQNWAILPESGWRIYKNPNVTYEGFMNVVAAVNGGKKLTTMANGDKVCLYKHEKAGFIFEVEPAYNRCDTDILEIMGKLEWAEV